MTARFLLLTLAAAGVAVLVTVIVAGTPLMYLWWVAAPGLTVATVAAGVRRHAPAHRPPWRMLVTALGMFWVGWSLSAWVGAGLGGPSDGVLTVVRNVLYLVAYPALGVASLMMVRCRTGGRDRDNVIDALIVMVALATVLGAWLFGTADFADAVAATDRAWVVISPLLLAAVVAASLRMVFAAGERLPAVWLLVISSVAALFGNLWTSQLLRDGAPTQVTGIDVLWILAFVAVGAAATHPSMRELTAPAPAPGERRGVPIDRIAVLAAGSLAAPLAHLRMSASDGSETVLVVAGGIVVVLLVVWRFARLLAERDAVRRALADSAARDALIAEVGRRALDEHTTAELLRVVDVIVADALHGARCTVEPATGPTGGGRSGGTFRVPVRDGEVRVADVSATFDDGRAPDDSERDFLDAVALLLSAGVRRRAAEDRLRHDARHDALTGLPNRAFVVDRLADLLEADADVTVIYIDLDGFKAINDTLGHEAGDAVLCEVAERLRGAVRGDDLVARLAGDEFVVLLASADRRPLEALVDRLLEAASVEVELDRGRSLRVAASVGVAAGRGGIGAEELLQHADAAMYRAKRGGGCRATWA